ncbi:hypothetical protein CEXT_497281 [Caerostris extrusa]|uniref:Uncharacterized protein n=1 Tax=Caerostris extrusa TaxID=172846 RepID=A0AAV4NBC0_CAEEX|nr:hypothetical protein CEXT_497281 [Caerostris extrusa]
MRQPSWARVGRLAKYNWLQPGWLSPSYQIWNASTFLARVGRIAKYTGYSPPSFQIWVNCLLVCFLSNMECIKLLLQGRPDSQKTTGYSRGVCLLPIKYGMR